MTRLKLEERKFKVMAKLIIEDSVSRKIGMTSKWWFVLVIGAGMGLLYWLFTKLIDQFIIEAIFCGSSFNADMCSNAIGTSGNLAGILVALIGLVLLIRVSTPRPLIVSIATFITLWGMASWTSGLGWAEIVAWEVLLFILSYCLFSWLSRYKRSAVAISLTLVAIIVLRILAML